MELKGAEIRNIKNLCSEMGTKGKDIPIKVNIPYYQRPYKWKKENIENLINDFDKNAKNMACKSGEDEKEKNEYFVGSAVMVKMPEKRHDVIDGQQRLTTMFLMIYLKFILQRTYVEELLRKKDVIKWDSALTELENVCGILFEKEQVKKISEVHAKIVEVGGDIYRAEDAEEKLNTVIKDFQDVVFLPEKNLTDEKEYMKKYCCLQEELLSENELCLKYNRESYNHKMKKALSRFNIIMSDVQNPRDSILSDEKDELVNQYLQALSVEFNTICSITPINDQKPMEYTKNLIAKVDDMLENIKFCVIITGNENDAYTLFEVLNDRALEIENLDLIKNLFYKWYCNHSSENDNKIDKCIEEIDKIWVEKVFSSDTGKEKSKMISYFAAVFFTADGSLKYNDNERYREILESKYLAKKDQYNSVDIKNDIYVYEMISMILNEYEFVFQNRNSKAIWAEEQTHLSVTYKTLHMLNALKQYGIMSALINVIVKQYIDENNNGKEIDIRGFSKYLNDLKEDSKNQNPLFEGIHKIAFELWRFSLLSPSSELPRQQAKKIIALNNVERLDYSYEISSNDMEKMENKFKIWMNDWRYGKAEDELKAKILFIDLYRTHKNDDKLEILATYPAFREEEIQLDHMEAKKVEESAREKFFKPKNAGELRETYINSIGNMMILDSKDNNDKNNQPLEMALKYYDNMNANHWMIMEVREMLKDEKYSKVCAGESECHVPKEEFFGERRSRLTAYFLTMLSRRLKQTSMDIRK